MENTPALYVEKVVRNHVKCTKCKNLAHKKCSRIWESTTKAINSICKRCQGLLDKNVDERITIDGDGIETVDRFSYLKDVLSTERGGQQTVTFRIRSAWENF